MKKSVEILLQEAISLKASDIFFFPKMIGTKLR